MQRRSFLAALAGVLAAPRVLENIAPASKIILTPKSAIPRKQYRTVRSGLPSVQWREINEGIVPLRATITQELVEAPWIARP